MKYKEERGARERRSRNGYHLNEIFKKGMFFASKSFTKLCAESKSLQARSSPSTLSLQSPVREENE